MRTQNIGLNSDFLFESLCRASFEECTRFYEDPENMKRFEKWKAERDAAAGKEKRQ